MRLTGTTRQFITPQGNAGTTAGRQPVEHEAVTFKVGVVVKFGASKVEQQAFETVASGVAIFGTDAQLVLHLFVEVFQQHLTGLEHRFADFPRKLQL
ncbi:hypothetical protein D3C78_1318390 [compost metagenome]